MIPRRSLNMADLSNEISQKNFIKADLTFESPLLRKVPCSGLMSAGAQSKRVQKKFYQDQQEKRSIVDELLAASDPGKCLH